MAQHHYVDKQFKLPLDCSFQEFRSARARLAWACNTRPDACYAACMASRTTGEKFCQKGVIEWNEVIRSIRGERLDLVYPRLDLLTLRLTVYTDSSYANCEDLSSEIGFVVMLTDVSGKCAVLDYAGKKSRRVVRSILGGEMMAFAEGFDRAFTVQHELSTMLSQRIPISMLTDSKGLFDVLVKSSSTQERRLMIDIAAAKQACDTKEKSDMGFIRSTHNLADGLTKLESCQALLDAMHTGRFVHPVEQWVIRSREEELMMKDTIFLDLKII
jgi:hypothetical protein